MWFCIPYQSITQHCLNTIQLLNKTYIYLNTYDKCYFMEAKRVELEPSPEPGSTPRRRDIHSVSWRDGRICYTSRGFLRRTSSPISEVAHHLSDRSAAYSHLMACHLNMCHQNYVFTKLRGHLGDGGLKGLCHKQPHI